jgi:hypothetical protein
MIAMDTVFAVLWKYIIELCFFEPIIWSLRFVSWALYSNSTVVHFVCDLFDGLVCTSVAWDWDCGSCFHSPEPCVVSSGTEWQVNSHAHIYRIWYLIWHLNLIWHSICQTDWISATHSVSLAKCVQIMELLFYAWTTPTDGRGWSLSG